MSGHTFLFLLLGSVASAGDFLPLQRGNTWNYRGGLNETFQIAVGEERQFGVRSYFRLTGYASEPLWVRRAEDGVLYWLDEVANREGVLADFRGTVFATPVAAPCEQSGQAQDRPVSIRGFSVATEVRYRVFNCADIGVDREMWVDNVGMVERVNTSFTGPRTFRLYSAKVGNMTYSDQPGVNFRVSIPTSVFARRNPADPLAISVTLSADVTGLDPVRLRFTSSQRYNIAIRDQAGAVVYLWSATALFLQVMGEEEFTSKEYVVPISVPLPDGRYQLEAWLTDASPDRKFSATASFQILAAP